MKVMFLAPVQACVGYTQLSYAWRSYKGTAFHQAKVNHICGHWILFRFLHGQRLKIKLHIQFLSLFLDVNLIRH